MLNSSRLFLGAALLIGVAACDTSTGLSTAITQADANQLAADMDAVAIFGESDFGLGPAFSVGVGESGASASVAVPGAINNSFTVTKQCPRGGQVTLAGTVVGTRDRETHSLTLDSDATRTDAACAFNTRNGVLTLTGNVAYTGHVNIVNAALVGLQTQTHKGSFTWARTGGSGTCEVDVTSSFDPATRTVTVTGRFCGHAVNVTRTRGS